MFYIAMGDSCEEVVRNLMSGNATPLSDHDSFENLDEEATIVQMTSGYRMGIVFSNCPVCHMLYNAWKWQQPVSAAPPMPPIHEAEFSLN